MINLPELPKKKLKAVEDFLKSKNIASRRKVLFPIELRRVIKKHMLSRISCLCNSTDRINGILMKSQSLEYDNIESMLNDIKDIKNIGIVDLKIKVRLDVDEKIISKTILINFIDINSTEYSGFTCSDSFVEELEETE